MAEEAGLVVNSAVITRLALLATTKILETPMSTFRNKCGVRRIVQSSRRFGLERTRLTEASVAVCFNSAHPTYLETICVLSYVAQI